MIFLRKQNLFSAQFSPLTVIITTRMKDIIQPSMTRISPKQKPAAKGQVDPKFVSAAGAMLFA